MVKWTKIENKVLGFVNQDRDLVVYIIPLGHKDTYGVISDDPYLGLGFRGEFTKEAIKACYNIDIE